MKKLIFLTLFLGISALGFTQKTNLIFFTEQGERFYLVLNGIQQNAEAQTNVMVTGLTAPSYKLKIFFEDPQLGEIDKNLVFGQGTETTYSIKRNNKNEWVVRYLSEVPLEQAPPPARDRYVMVYSTTPPPPPATTVIVNQQTTTTTTSAPAGGVGVGISIQDNEGGVNMNMNVSGNMGPSTTTTTSSTSTTIVTTGTASGPAIHEEHPASVMPGYTGPVGCPVPMSPGEFMQVKSSVESKSFDDSKLIIAKQVISANCLLCAQVREIMLLFSFEDTRLELAKFAYGYTYDIGNYYKLNDAFTFESSIEELNEYINGFKW